MIAATYYGDFVSQKTIGMEYLNIPIGLLTDYKASKSRKELLSFAIAIKCLHVNSVVTDVSVKKIMRLFHVSNAKAKRLLQDAKNSPLFSYSERTNQLRVKTFKDKSYKVAKNGMRYISDYCYKLERKVYSIKELCRIISDVLIKNAIHAVQMDKLLKSGAKSPSSYAKGLNMRKLSRIAGISLSSVSRTVNRMWQNHEIEKTRHHAELVIPVVNEQTVSEWNRYSASRPFFYNKKDNTGWIFKPSEYSLNSSGIQFTHVIYSHMKRRTINVADTFSSDIERIYSTIHAF